MKKKQKVNGKWLKLKVINCVGKGGKVKGLNSRMCVDWSYLSLFVSL